MQEGKRQKMVGKLLQEELNKIFLKLGLNVIDGGMISISTVKVTPDLLEARVYLSLFQVKDPEDIMKKVEDRAWEVKKELAAHIRNQVRRIPILSYFRDETLDNVYKMEELFEKIKKEDFKNQSPEE